VNYLCSDIFRSDLQTTEFAIGVFLSKLTLLKGKNFLLNFLVKDC